MKKKIISTILILSLLSSNAIITFAVPQNELDEARTKYAELQKDTARIMNKVAELNSVIEPMDQKVKENKKQINDINNQVINTKKEIEDTKEEIKEKEVLVGERLREVYKTGGQMNYIFLIFEADSFSDLIDRIDTVKRLVNLDKKVVKELAKKKDKLNEKILSLDEKAKIVKKLNQDIEKELSVLNVKKEEQLKLSEESDAIRKNYEKTLAIMEIDNVSNYLTIANNRNSDTKILASTIEILENYKKGVKSDIAKKEISSALNIAKSELDKREQEEEWINRGNGYGSVDGVISEAFRHIGKAYVYGANGPSNFDCSGLTSYVYLKATGIYIGRDTGAQLGSGRSVARSEMKPGDLIFTHPWHVGIYLGNNKMIHSPTTGQRVEVQDVWSFYAARRILQ